MMSTAVDFFCASAGAIERNSRFAREHASERSSTFAGGQPSTTARIAHAFTWRAFSTRATGSLAAPTSSESTSRRNSGFFEIVRAAWLRKAAHPVLASAFAAVWT
ncbi:MAG: hypothetical protein M0D55_01495 [Elusimicrobiota bacterium]|nr:MAG: hypothetical protein M0D55_01495 [Elusimicrobiota bacterium]